MRVDLMPRRMDFVEAHRYQKYRTFRCSGSCSIEIVALAGAALWCGQPGCRGSMKPSYPVSSTRLAIEQFEVARDRCETPRFTPNFFEVLASERPWKSTGDGLTHDGDFRALFEGITVGQELVIEALIDGGTGAWCWAKNQGGNYDC